jgi:DNA-binding transcriptional LysR family regulator
MLEEFHHLKLISELGTFTQAARAAHLSQPALTASIQRLEGWMGAQLLHRGRQGASLTAAGKALLPHARDALAAVEAGSRAVAEVSGLKTGEVRIGCGATAATTMLPSVLARFRRRYPGVRIILRELYPRAVREALSAGDLDIGVATSPTEFRHSDRWRNDEYVLIADPRDDRKDPPFITFPEGTDSRAALERAFPDADVVMELGSFPAVIRHVREGVGIALISRSSVERHLRAGTLIERKSRRTPIKRRLVLIHNGVERLSPAAAALRQLLLESQ